jgi:hypothetical protein
MSAATLTPTKPVRAARKVEPKAGSLCVVNIGAHLSAVMPLRKGLDLLEIMAGATIVERNWGIGDRDEYFERKQIGPTELKMIDADQLMPLLAKPAPKESGVKP